MSICGCKRETWADLYYTSFIQVTCWEAGVWLPAVNNFCHSVSCLKLFFWVPHTFLSAGRSAGAFFSYLQVPPPLILPSIISCSTCPNHTCWRFLTLSNTALVSFTLCRTSSLFIFFTQLIFSILLEVQIHISMASNLFLSARVIDRVSDAYNTTLFNTLFTILFTTLYSNCPWTVSFIHKCLFTQRNPMTCLSPTVLNCWNNTSQVFECVNLL